MLLVEAVTRIMPEEKWGYLPFFTITTISMGNIEEDVM